MSVYSSSQDFLNEMVEPDFKDAVRSRESLRHAYHVCVSLFSLRDWVFSEFANQPGWPFGKTEDDFQRHLQAVCPELAIVSDIANSGKHRLLKRNRSGVLGSDHVALYGAGGIGVRPIGTMPNLEVLVGDKIFPLLETAEKVLWMWRALLEKHEWG